MVTSLPTGRRGRALALAITLLLLAVVWIGVVSPLLDLSAARSDHLRERSAIALRMARLADQLPDLQARAATVEHEGPPPMLTIEGGSDAVAASKLLSMVQDLATAAGVSLTSIEPPQVDSVGSYRRLGLKLSFNAPWPVLVQLLKSIESAKPPLLIDDLEIHATPAAPGGPPQGLDIGFTVYAFRAAGTAPVAPS